MRVVSVTPAGRRRYIEILVPHLLRQRHVIQEHHWWLNTNVAEDIAYIHQLCADHPDFFRVCVKSFDVIEDARREYLEVLRRFRSAGHRLRAVRRRHRVDGGRCGGANRQISSRKSAAALGLGQHCEQCQLLGCPSGGRLDLEAAWHRADLCAWTGSAGEAVALRDWHISRF